jgi:hypothetical protein
MFVDCDVVPLFARLHVLLCLRKVDRSCAGCASRRGQFLARRSDRGSIPFSLQVPATTTLSEIFPAILGTGYLASSGPGNYGPSASGNEAWPNFAAVGLAGEADVAGPAFFL